MLSVKDLAVSFQTRRGPVEAVRGISFDLAKGEILGPLGQAVHEVRRHILPECPTNLATRALLAQIVGRRHQHEAHHQCQRRKAGVQQDP